MTNPVEVRLWGSTIGAVYQAPNTDYCSFQYDRDFAHSHIQVAPIMMPLAEQVYAFPQLARQSFSGLPGMIADSLPDRFGNALINAWLARQGKDAGSFGALERLCYVGTRGMGALEYRPAVGPQIDKQGHIEIESLIRLAGKILDQRNDFSVTLLEGEEEEAMAQLLKVGTSAGGARPKAILAWNPETKEVRSGQIYTEDGFQYWILKFDGLSETSQTELSSTRGYGAIEYAYFLMAQAAGIHMSESRLLEENGRRHFMTKRFDRTDDGSKLHMQSFGGMAHFDFNMAGAYGYEQALRTIRKLGLSVEAVEEQFRRMVFNVMARNQDDHVKNIAFLMSKSGEWKLSPAFDVTYSFNPSGDWTARHQMTVNGKSENITVADLKAVGTNASIQKGSINQIIEQVKVAVSNWKEHFSLAGVAENHTKTIAPTLLYDLPLT